MWSIPSIWVYVFTKGILHGGTPNIHIRAFYTGVTPPVGVFDLTYPHNIGLNCVESPFTISISFYPKMSLNMGTPSRYCAVEPTPGGVFFTTNSSHTILIQSISLNLADYVLVNVIHSQKTPPGDLAMPLTDIKSFGLIYNSSRPRAYKDIFIEKRFEHISRWLKGRHPKVLSGFWYKVDLTTVPPSGKLWNCASCCNVCM